MTVILAVLTLLFVLMNVSLTRNLILLVATLRAPSPPTPATENGTRWRVTFTKGKPRTVDVVAPTEGAAIIECLRLGHTEAVAKLEKL